MMRILLTGVSGQLGGALKEILSYRTPVLSADRSVLDLSRPHLLTPILDRLAPDLIINPAAYTAVDQAEDDDELAHLVNAEAPGVMAQWAANRGVPMVHFSTDYVFDGSGDRPWREDDPTNALSVYGASKLAGETAIREAGGSHLIIRTSWVFASRGQNFLNTIGRLARERQELRIVADQIGAPTSARSVAQALTSMLSSGDQHEPDPTIDLIKSRFAEVKGLVHMSNKGETSWYGFATAIVDGLRCRGVQLAVCNIVAIDTKDFPTKATRPLNSRLDMTRLEQVYGIEMPNWRVALDVELDQMP
jgi:dTDP-4-dehydrorhamnose reductase